MEKSNEPGIFQPRKSESHLTFLQSFSILVAGIFLGYLLSKQLVSTTCNMTELSDQESFSKSDTQNHYIDNLDMHNTEKESILDTFSSHRMLCNARGAYEELTKLYRRSKDLNEHKKRGEANLSRQATISRKANGARAAEHAFRECVHTMMPNLLNLWDESLKKGEINFRGWNDAREEKNDGVTLALLEDTADLIESDLRIRHRLNQN